MKGQQVAANDKTATHNNVSADPKFKDHNMHKDADMKSHDVSAHDSTVTHTKVCADPQCSCHDMHKDTQMKGPQVAAHDKTATHNNVSADPKFKDHNMHKDADMKGQQVAANDKTATHNEVSADAKLAAHNLTEIHEQISVALAGAKFPVNTPADLISAFPDGASTKCHSGNLTMTAGEAGKLLRATDFPFANAKAVADVIVQRASL
jgi:hypothetical protein